MPSTTCDLVKPAASIALLSRASVSRVWARTSPLVASVLPSIPDRYSRLPARMAGLRFGLAGRPSLMTLRGAVEAVNVISTRRSGAMRPAMTVARAGGSLGNFAR
jgi:hypothetical protein